MKFQEILLKMSFKTLRTLMRNEKRQSNIDKIDQIRKNSGLITQILTSRFEKALAQLHSRKAKGTCLWVQTQERRPWNLNHSLNKTNVNDLTCLNEVKSLSQLTHPKSSWK